MTTLSGVVCLHLLYGFRQAGDKSGRITGEESNHGCTPKRMADGAALGWITARLSRKKLRCRPLILKEILFAG